MNTYSRNHCERHGERGVTIVFVALAMVAICAIAALSVDVITLYLAREEAQRSADAAALAAARVLSLSGVIGDLNNIQGSLPVAPWQAACTLASQTAQAVVKQNTIGHVAVASSATVTFLYNGTATSDCSAGGTFATNPQVKVDVVQSGLPTFFARIWSRATNQVSATATAEAFNPSYSSSAPSGLVTVSPRCVKPWIVRNTDPNNFGNPFVGPTGAIGNPGILQSGTGIIGSTFTLTADCKPPNPDCKGGLQNNPPSSNPATHTLDYVPALIAGTSVAVPSCATGSAYQEAIGGCDQSTLYACGIVGGGVQADLTFDPGKPGGDTANATECLIHQQAGVGQDSLDTTPPFPFRIQAGTANPVIANNVVTSSNSIVTLPIYDTPGPLSGTNPPVDIVGFLQVFINNVDGSGNPNVTVLNVAGCSNTATTSTPTVSGTSPVPVRLITPQ